MEQTERQLISATDLFGAVEDMLAEDRQAQFIVTGNSMWPLISSGRDSVIVEKCSPEQLHKGDIVLLKAMPGRYLLHRITAVRGDLIETTGDGNCHRDGFFKKSAVIARVVTVFRKQKRISFGSLGWRLVFRCWMALFGIRKQLLSGLRLLLRVRNRLKRLHKQ